MNRREFFAMTASGPLVAQATRSARPLVVCVHQVSSNGFDYRASLEGYAKAGIRAVEVVLAKAKEFADQSSAKAARTLLDDLGLKAVSSSNQLGIVEPNPNRAKALDDLKWKCELAQILGADRLVVVPVTTAKITVEDYKRGVDNLREAAEIARPFGVSLMLEFFKFSTFINSLSTSLMVVRAANHPNVRLMMDTFHFWNGPSKLEDFDQLHDGELAHLHFEDTPGEPPRELIEQRHRVLPGDGVVPLKKIVDAAKQKGYAGPLSVELTDPQFQSMDPYQLATKIRKAVEPFTG
jgi:sugar phosphate isomerase/epimerase